MFLFSRSEWPSMPVLGPIADAYVNHLQHGGYRLTTVAVYCNSVSHLAHWMSAEQLSLAHLDERLVSQFVAEHLPHCRCSSPRQSTVSTVRAALLHLLRVLRAQDLLGPQRFPGPSSVQQELQRFLLHLEQVGGLAPATRLSRQRWVRQFLLDRFGWAPIHLEQVSPRDLVDFLLRQKERYKPGTAGVIGCALRSYLRFRALQDGDRVETLIAAVPTVAHWRLAALPTPLTQEEVSRVLSAFDLHCAHGQRGYAMARCLADLGLRTQEVAALQLDDFNWPEGTLLIRSGKSRRGYRLPLPAATGQAIVQYLQGARSQSASRALFVRHRAPFHLPVDGSIVRYALRTAFERCGLADRYSGPHQLRHSVATQMLQAGASLKEIADLLRHQSLDTTMIYTKVDLPRLAAVAAPWPGSVL